MSKLLTRIAANAYVRGDYRIALAAYKELSDLIGERFFSLNIKSCESKIRQENGRNPELLPVRDIKVACIMDEFTFHSYDPECNLLQLTPDNAIQELENFKPDLLFVESAWRGKEELWNRKIANISQELKLIINWCETNLVKTIFWNKEDPVHFETFLNTAKLFDVVFTTDIDCISQYKAALDHDQVYFLPFACQTKVNNPIELFDRKDAFCFAGAYYLRYPSRTADLEGYIKELPNYKPIEIYDRNFGKEDENYKFPEVYSNYIVGSLPFSEIDKAYKGYRYSINLNSIKQSQTMCARRIFELLASNTLTVSNFSRAVRLMFGDLIVSTDNAKEVVRRLTDLEDKNIEKKIRLQALRKVLSEHTYEHRLSYIAQKALNSKVTVLYPLVTVIAFINNKEEIDSVYNSFINQCYSKKKLVIFSTLSLDQNTLNKFKGLKVDVFDLNLKKELFWADILINSEWLSLMVAADYYGPNYLYDLVLATKYSNVNLIGKCNVFVRSRDGVRLSDAANEYSEVTLIPIRSSLFRPVLLDCSKISEWLPLAPSKNWETKGLAIDSFNYCQNGKIYENLEIVTKVVDDLKIDVGLSLANIVEVSEGIGKAHIHYSDLKMWTASTIFSKFKNKSGRNLKFDLVSDRLTIISSLEDEKHEYCYAEELLDLNQIAINEILKVYIDCTPGADLRAVFIFFNEAKERIHHVIFTCNKNHTSDVPSEARYFKFGLRILGPGVCIIKSLQFDHIKLEPSSLIGKANNLVLTNHYPSYDDIYKNGFVHSRVKAYKEKFVDVDVFRFRSNEPIAYHEYKNVDVTTAGQSALKLLLGTGLYKNVMVHFLNDEMWDVLKEFPDINIFVWIHGAEIHAWHRRRFNYTSEIELAKAKSDSDKRMKFWEGVLRTPPKNLNLIFVSEIFSKEIFEDLNISMPKFNYHIIHNPIDVNLFNYIPKPIEQRKKILSIRPFASRQYANDLAVNAILELSRKEEFNDLFFHIIGDGALFDEIIEPIKNFNNVLIERKFLNQDEIAKLHKKYGVFLVPTRWDSHGVSRDEAMSSGLVPITNNIAAIPEFVNEECGYLVEPENSTAIANAILDLYYNPDLFQAKSVSSQSRIRMQSSSEVIIPKEIKLL
jgi:glycosyltransferase involved in cell wall biosynthesis/spore maturation protein CgeB